MTLEELKESVERNELTCLACNQGFEETLADVQSDNPGLSEEDLAEAVLDRMLDENLPYGKYADEDGDEDSGERLAVRCSIREQVVSEWLAGEYSGKGEPELALARRRAAALADEYAGSVCDGVGSETTGDATNFSKGEPLAHESGNNGETTHD
jgi:hypothetical protein